jgi:hypothetical protein
MEGVLHLVGDSDELPDVGWCRLVGGDDGRRDLCREGVWVVPDDLWHEGVAPGGEHELSKPFAGDQLLGMEIEQYGVRSPVSDEFDGVGIDMGTEESCGSPRSHGVCTDEFGRNAGGCFNRASGFMKALGDVVVGNPTPFVCESFVVLVELLSGFGFPLLVS